MRAIVAFEVADLLDVQKSDEKLREKVIAQLIPKATEHGLPHELMVALPVLANQVVEKIH